MATRLERGDLLASFIPPREVRELRELTRLRVHWLEDLNRVKNRIGEVCEIGNIKVSSVASRLFGESGRRMLEALVEGKRDAGWMADYARGRLRQKRGQLQLALQGSLTEHHRQLLGWLLEQMEELEKRIRTITEEIERRMAGHEEQVQRLCTIPGIQRVAAWTILAEIGFDLSVFPSARHLASWAAVCPGNRESGGKRMSGKTRKGNIYVRRILCQCALAATRTKGCSLAQLYYRVRGRKGHPKAVMATAHQLLLVVYQLLTRHQDYVEQAQQPMSEQARMKQVEWHVLKLHGLGLQVDLRPVEPPAPSQTPVETVLSHAAASSLPRRRGRPCKCAERGLGNCQHKTRGRENSPEKSSQAVQVVQLDDQAGG